MSSPYDFLKHSVEARDLTNLEFGDYHVIRRIGSGAMADVYLAEQRSLGRRVALKVLKLDLSADETYVKRFLREAKAAARLIHTNIVHIYEVGERDHLRYIAQEYVQGNNLAQYLQHHGAMTPKQVFLVIWQVASALEVASQAGIVHRDIKPENILLGDRLEVKVADFGLARIEDSEDPELQLTKIGITLGTPLYMSPEQSEGKPLDHRSDIYSLGITGYHMLAGHPPFRGDTALSVAIQHLKKEPEMLETIRPDIPPALARIVHRMIAKSPKDRFQSIRQLKLELKQLHAHSFRSSNIADTLADWEALPLDVADSSLIAMTEKLQSTMIFETKLLKKRRRFWPILLIGFTVFLIGAIMGARRDNPEAFLELDNARVSEIPTKKDVYQQWVFALFVQKPEAWQAVIDKWNDPVMSLMAKRQLGWYYFQKGMPEAARPYFKECSQLGSAEAYKDYVSFGKFGLLWVSLEEGNVSIANQLKNELMSGSDWARYVSMANSISNDSPPNNFDLYLRDDMTFAIFNAVKDR